MRTIPRLTKDGDGDWDYICPKCCGPVIAGQAMQTRVPHLKFKKEGDREWFAVTCGRCGYYDLNPGEVEVIERPLAIAPPPIPQMRKPSLWTRFSGFLFG